MKITEKVNELVQKLMEENPNTKLTIGYLHKGEMSFKLLERWLLQSIVNLSTDYFCSKSTSRRL